MKDIGSNSIKYNGKRWTLLVLILVDDMDSNNPDLVFSLDNTNILRIRYSNSFNSLYLVGDIDYIDKYGQLDKLLDRQFAYCQIIMVEHKEKNDGGIDLQKFDESIKFNHTFLINSVKITNRETTTIEYQLKLVSANWFNCLQSVTYTNYDKSPEPIFDILAACIDRSGLKIDKDSFDYVKSNVKINYITNGNDNLITTTNFLLNKLYYYLTKDDSLKMLVYNEQADNFLLFDYKKLNMANDIYTVILSMFKSSTESMTDVEPNELATVVEFPVTDYVRNVMKYKVKDYDFELNLFFDVDILPEQIADYMNNKNPTNEFEIRNKIPHKGFNATKSESYWNNNIDIYQKAILQQLKMNSLVINTAGDILKKPGSLVTVSLDKSMVTQLTESTNDLQDLKSKYTGLEGVWTVSKVVHIIEPMASRYRQNVTLSRNYMKKEGRTTN